MRYQYLVDFRRGISVFAIFSYGIAVLGTPPMSPSYRLNTKIRLTMLCLSGFELYSRWVPM